MRSRSDRCVHNVKDRMNHIFQGSLVDQVVRRSPTMQRVPGSIPGVVNETLSKNTKILFLIEDISELECWHLVLDAWFLGCSGNAPGLWWKSSWAALEMPGLQWKCLGCSGNGSLSQDLNPVPIMGNDVRGREMQILNLKIDSLIWFV